MKKKMKNTPATWHFWGLLQLQQRFWIPKRRHPHFVVFIYTKEEKVLKMYYKHLNGFSRAPGNGNSCWSVGDTKISFLNTLAENGPCPYSPLDEGLRYCL